ncbi:hypothetical protein [Lentilactobacillus sp. Marseille-Q4993]|uniref:hypothetical protein n=1 Tax=Lentilactobacillus sp. Marseille-Q4993 TaxID=3039492 RepID=UPI0024BCC3D6|nr:hypothetical protein [Lentilactobacillus sp. Marseille-Q4993]
MIWKGKRVRFVLGIAALGIGMGGFQNTHASSRYRVLKVNKQWTGNAYYYKNLGTTAYMYNGYHTKKLHNLKDYPRTTWFVQKSVVLQSPRGKKGVYYQVANGSSKVIGYVWRGYLKKGQNPATAKKVVKPKVLYSNVSANDSAKIFEEDGMDYKYPYLTGLSSYENYAKTPTNSQLNTVVNFIKKQNAEQGLPTSGKVDANAKNWQNFRIVMLPVQKHTSIRLPFVQAMSYEEDDDGTFNYQGGPEWSTIGSFWSFYYAATTQSQDVYKFPKGGRAADFPFAVFEANTYMLPNDSIINDNIMFGDGTVIYLNENRKYTAILSSNRMIFVKTAYILNFTKGNIIKNGIQYGMGEPTATDSKKGTVYRKVDNDTNSGYDEYRYTDGKWQKTYSLMVNGEYVATSPVSPYIYKFSGTNFKGVDVQLPYSFKFPSKQFDNNYYQSMFLPSSYFDKYLK